MTSAAADGSWAGARLDVGLEDARRGIDAALAKAAELGVAVNVAVVERGGRLVAFVRMDGAFAESGPIAVDKAWTVTGFEGLGSDELYAAIKDEPDVLAGIGGRPRVSLFAGGLPVRRDNLLIGAVGVSGATAAQDKEIAAAAQGAIEGASGNGTPGNSKEQA